MPEDSACACETEITRWYITSSHINHLSFHIKELKIVNESGKNKLPLAWSVIFFISEFGNYKKIVPCSSSPEQFILGNHFLFQIVN